MERVRALPVRASTARTARLCRSGKGGPEGKLRGRPPPPHCRAPDLGDGRGLNPSPDEREPARAEYYASCARKTTCLKVVKATAALTSPSAAARGVRIAFSRWFLRLQVDRERGPQRFGAG